MTYMDPFPRGTRISQDFRQFPGGYNPAGGHTGRDYAVRSGTPVRAAADGIIRNSGWLTSNHLANPWWLTNFGGDTVVLDCTDAFGRSETMPTFVYAHLLSSPLAVGTRVKKGQIIGISGNSGTATSGDHCHVERLNPNWNWHNGVYGRSPLNFDEYWDGGDVSNSSSGAGAAAGPAKTPPPLEEEDEKMLIIAKAEGDDRIWIGDGVTRRHIPNSQTLDAYQWLARNGLQKIVGDGAVQTIPAGVECIGADVTGSVQDGRRETQMHEEHTRKVLIEQIAVSNAVELAELIPDAFAQDVINELLGRLQKK